MIKTFKTLAGYDIYHSNGTFLGDTEIGENGFYVFYPNLVSNFWEQEVLFELAQTLEDLNRDWVEHINIELEQAAQSCKEDPCPYS